MVLSGSGSTRVCIGRTNGQRGWKRHPGGGWSMSGGEPGMPVSRCFSPVRDGKELIRPCV